MLLGRSQFAVATEDEARALLGDRTGRVGTGAWRITARVNEANGNYTAGALQDQPCPAGSPPQVCTPDAGNWVRVGLSYNTYRPELRVV